MPCRILQSVFALILLASIAGGAAAQDLPSPEPEEDRPVEIEIDLVQVLEQARQAMRDRDYEKAVGLYQFVLRYLPDSRVARVELSFALAVLGEQERAARLLRDLDTTGLDPTVIDLIDSIVGPDRLNFFFVPEVFFDTNINEQTKDDRIQIGNVIVGLTEEAQGRDGWGYGSTFGASYRLRDLDPRLIFTGGLTILDFSGSQDDEQIFFGSVSSRFDVADWLALTPGLNLAYRYDDWRPREAEVGFGLSAAMAFGAVRNTVGTRYRDVSGQPNDGGSRLNRDEYEVSNIFSFGFRDTAIRWEERYIYEDWENLDTQDNWELQSGLDFTYLDLPWVVPTVGGAFTYRDFKNDTPFFNKERLDREWTGRVEILLRDIDLFGSNPFIEYKYTNQDSNIPLVDYDKHEVSIGIRAIVF